MNPARPLALESDGLLELAIDPIQLRKKVAVEGSRLRTAWCGREDRFMHVRGDSKGL